MIRRETYTNVYIIRSGLGTWTFASKPPFLRIAHDVQPTWGSGEVTSGVPSKPEEVCGLPGADLELPTFQKTSKCGWAVCATTKTHWQTVGSGAPLGVSV